MLLNELKDTQQIEIIKEGRIDIQVKMILGDVLRNGKITNGAQTYVLSRLILLLKSGTVVDIDKYETVTPVEIVNYVKALPPDQLLQLVQVMITQIEAEDYNWCQGPTMGIVDWVRYITKAER